MRGGAKPGGIAPAHIIIWLVAATATAGVIARPFKLPEAAWSVSGAVVLVAAGLLPLRDAFGAVLKGDDVYLFLAGMLLLSETSRREGLFDWVAAIAVDAAKGSSKRLFLLIYIAGTIVTVFLSNDATAVVLTPAVISVARKARVEALPLLFICAFVANAASFVLPISNPANLVLYGDRMPALTAWLSRFALASLLSILATYAALRFTQRDALEAPCATAIEPPTLSAGGWTALGGIGATAIALLAVSSLGMSLGLPTAIMGVLTMLCVAALRRTSPWASIRGVSWGVLPLVAGLFVLVEGVAHTGAIAAAAQALRNAASVSETGTAALAGGAIAIACNLINNLPTGLIARSILAQAHAATQIVDAALIGVDLGPNLSVTGSLATILWLGAIRREGQHVGFARFLATGIVVMPPALLLALCARLFL